MGRHQEKGWLSVVEVFVSVDTRQWEPSDSRTALLGDTGLLGDGQLARALRRPWSPVLSVNTYTQVICALILELEGEL